jgi:hypothetical protein
MAQRKSLLNNVLTRVTKVSSKPSENQDNLDKSKMTMDTFMRAINPHGNPIKIFSPVIDILIHSRPTTRVVMGFLLENMKQGTHIAELKWQKFVKKGYGSRDTFYRGLIDLKEKKMIQKYSGTFYEVNPDFAFKGNLANYLEKVKEAKN